MSRGRIHSRIYLNDPDYRRDAGATKTGVGWPVAAIDGSRETRDSTVLDSRVCRNAWDLYGPL